MCIYIRRMKEMSTFLYYITSNLLAYTGGYVGGSREYPHNFGKESAILTTEKEMDLRKMGYGDGKWVGVAQDHAHYHLLIVLAVFCYHNVVVSLSTVKYCVSLSIFRWNGEQSEQSAPLVILLLLARFA